MGHCWTSSTCCRGEQYRQTVNMKKDLEMMAILFFTVFVTVQALKPVKLRKRLGDYMLTHKLRNGHLDYALTGEEDAVVTVDVQVPSGKKAQNIDLKLKNAESKTVKSVHDPKKFTVKPGKYAVEISGENLHPLVAKKVDLRGTCLLVAHMDGLAPGTLSFNCKL